MVPISWLLKLGPRIQPGTLARTLRTSEGLLKRCGDGGKKSRDAEDMCMEECKSGKKKKSKFCDKESRGQGSGEANAGELPDMCSRQAALDCARQVEELQKKWEAVARAAERADAAAQRAGGSKRAAGCPVKAPPQPEKEGGSSMPIVLALMAVIAGVAYYIYSQSQEGEGGEGEGGEGEDKDKKKDLPP